MDYFSAARALAPMVDELRGAFDQDRSLPLSLVDAMGKAGLFGLWQPRALGGPELAPVSLLKVTEELARQDASVGWCAVIPAGYSRLAGCSATRVMAGPRQPDGRSLRATKMA